MKTLTYTDIVQTRFFFQEGFNADTLRSPIYQINSGRLTAGSFF
ncbi:hypothetical protein QWY86_05165 [Pedobacter aquatilis]|nr:hypothetical protein [Pedobacter aquatilis]